jgi:hypothetical protein
MIDLSDKKSLYKIHKKKKSNGKLRIIYAPCNELKDEQNELAKKLSLEYFPPDFVSGFIAKRNASWDMEKHTDRKWVCELDVKDFFPSIREHKLIKELNLSEYEASIATLDGKLVQGSPCSPLISNMFFYRLDLFFHSYLKSIDVNYTRYADNIVLSGDDENYTHAIATIRVNCNKSGFFIPRGKIKLMFHNQEQKVLGITLNSKISINHKVRKKLRNTMKYSAITNVERGYVSYVNSINKEQALTLKGI